MECCGSSRKRYAKQDHYGAVQKVVGHYRSVTGPLLKRYGTLWKHCGSITGCCEALWNITEHCVTLCIVMEHYGSVMQPLQSVTKCYGAIMERYGRVMGCYGTLRKCYRWSRRETCTKSAYALLIESNALKMHALPSRCVLRVIPSEFH